MKIALLGTRGVPASYSGFETCVEQLGQRLAERGHEHLVAYWRELGRLQTIELADKFRTGGLEACREYWTRIVQEENCLADLELTEDYFEFRMRQCPSLSKAMDVTGT